MTISHFYTFFDKNLKLPLWQWQHEFFHFNRQLFDWPIRLDSLTNFLTIATLTDQFDLTFLTDFFTWQSILHNYFRAFPRSSILRGKTPSGGTLIWRAAVAVLTGRACTSGRWKFWPPSGRKQFKLEVAMGDWAKLTGCACTSGRPPCGRWTFCAPCGGKKLKLEVATGDWAEFTRRAFTDSGTSSNENGFSA